MAKVHFNYMLLYNLIIIISTPWILILILIIFLLQKKNQNNNNNNENENVNVDEGCGGCGKKPKSPAAAAVSVVVLKMDLHCEGCAGRVVKAVRTLDGVESVRIGDSELTKITVIGNLDPAKLRQKVEEKTKKKVELISPAAKKTNAGDGDGGDNKKQQKQPPQQPPSEKTKTAPKKEDKKPKEIPVTTAVLKVPLHCQGCVRRIHKLVTKTKGNFVISPSSDQFSIAFFFFFTKLVTCEQNKGCWWKPSGKNSRGLWKLFPEERRRRCAAVRRKGRAAAVGEKKGKENDGEGKGGGGDGGGGGGKMEVMKMESFGAPIVYPIRNTGTGRVMEITCMPLNCLVMRTQMLVL
ncbi:hypothetical protein OSB04_013516 [Centaurea solstitialis]|uniref:HMA domain-containing protein n=1 Tax=Centaurea solstitialis TaxID=347529 RepID=A0AA38WFK5_9ASTR|nr:hypothetical protein OSB04_013516 [Centaurea solstitialis]